jgi:hypothetical protein
MAWFYARWQQRVSAVKILTTTDALAFIREHGVVLASAKGPVPTLTEAVTGTPIRGSWWGHRDGRKIFRILSDVRACDDVLVCRLVDNKITLVHRRLWPALIRAATQFPQQRLARVAEVHMPDGRHQTIETPLPEWAPPDIKQQAQALTATEALNALGPWTAELRHPRE